MHGCCCWIYSTVYVRPNGILAEKINVSAIVEYDLCRQILNIAYAINFV